MTKSYGNIADLLNTETSGLQETITPEQLDQLIDGTLAPSVIADEYLADLEMSTVATVTTSPEETRRDLLAWIRSEIEIAVEQRNEDAREATLAELAAFDKDTREKKMALIEKARRQNITKAVIAENLGISRPTLDKMIVEQADRALFDRAAFELVRADVPATVKDALTGIIAIRDTRKQADVLLGAVLVSDLLDLTDDARAIVDTAIQRARTMQ